MDTEPFAKDMTVKGSYCPERLPGKVLNAIYILCGAGMDRELLPVESSCLISSDILLPRVFSLVLFNFIL